MDVRTIPRQFIRIWLGPHPLPQMFEDWWEGFKEIHPDFQFITLTDETVIELPPALEEIYYSVDTYAGRSDILRLLALYEFGGIYVDTDMMPLKSFERLLIDKPFIGMRSSKSFANGVIGCPAKHPAMYELINSLPAWYLEHRDRSASVQTGPAFVSAKWFGRDDIEHLAIETFYPYNGFMAPNRQKRLKIFTEKEFPPEMLAAHFGNHRWGGIPKDRVINAES